MDIKKEIRKKGKKSSIVLILEKFIDLIGLDMFIVSYTNQRVWLVSSLPIF